MGLKNHPSRMHQYIKNDALMRNRTVKKILSKFFIGTVFKKTGTNDRQKNEKF